MYELKTGTLFFQDKNGNNVLALNDDWRIKSYKDGTYEFVKENNYGGA